jgi:hypothetical protein
MDRYMVRLTPVCIHVVPQGPCGGGDDSWCQGVNGTSELPLSCQPRPPAQSASSASAVSQTDDVTAAAERPEVVAFYGQDSEPECTPSYWLDFPAGTVTTIIMQGWMDPFMIQYAHAHGMRVVMAQGSCGVDCSKLADPAVRASQVNSTMNAARSLGVDGIGWDLESVDVGEPAVASAIALYLAEFKAAWPESFHTFYIGNLQHRNRWEAAGVKAVAASVDLVIVSAYAETNDTAPEGPGRTACVRPCGSTSLPTVESALHDPVDGWANVVVRIPKSSSKT